MPHTKVNIREAIDVLQCAIDRDHEQSMFRALIKYALEEIAETYHKALMIENREVNGEVGYYYCRSLVTDVIDAKLSEVNAHGDM